MYPLTLLQTQITVSPGVPKVEFWRCEKCNLVTVVWRQTLRDSEKPTWGLEIKRFANHAFRFTS